VDGDLAGRALTQAGFEPWEFLLEPADGGWKLDLAFKKSPPPVER
jgi:hypothetical protein